jgi:hypothetical protein
LASTEVDQNKAIARVAFWFHGMLKIPIESRETSNKESYFSLSPNIEPVGLLQTSRHITKIKWQPNERDRTITAWQKTAQ